LALCLAFILGLNFIPPSIGSVNYEFIFPDKLSLTVSVNDASDVSRVLAEILGMNHTMSLTGNLYQVEVAGIKLYEIDSLPVRIFAYDSHGNTAIKQITIVPSIEEKFISYSIFKGFEESLAKRFYSEYDGLVRNVYSKNVSILLHCLELYSKNATVFAELYRNTYNDIQTLITYVADVKFIEFIKSHPDCLSLRPIISSPFISPHPSNQDIYELWRYLISKYDNKTISDYYYLFKAAVDIYSDYFMYTTSEPIPYNQTPTNFSIDLNEKALLKNIIDLFIEWNENRELFVNLQSLEPIKELAINADSSYEYLECLLDISTGGWHLPKPNVPILGHESWYLNTNWLNDVLNCKWGPSYVVFLVTKTYFEDILPRRHVEIWEKVKSETMKETFAILLKSLREKYGYNVTTFDAAIYAVHHLSLALHRKENCLLNTAEMLTDLRSVGLSSVTANYPIHSDIAPWFSKYYISSQEKYGGALNYNNFIVMHPSNLELAKRGPWDWIEIRLPWDIIKVYDTPHFEVYVRGKPNISIKTGERTNMTVEITILSKNGFCLPINIQFKGTGAWAPYPNWVENSMDCNVTIQNATLIPPPNGTISTYAEVSMVPKIAGKHFIIFNVSCPSTDKSREAWIIVEVKA
jgi:hypothetical protein